MSGPFSVVTHARRATVSPMDLYSAPRSYVPDARTAERMPRATTYPVPRARRDLSDLWDAMPLGIVALALAALQVCAFCGVFGPSPF